MLKKFLTLLVTMVLFLNAIPLETLAETVASLGYEEIIAAAREVDAEEETSVSDLVISNDMTAYELWALLETFMSIEVEYALNLHSHLIDLCENGAVSNENQAQADSLSNGEDWEDFMELWSHIDHDRFEVDSARSDIRHYLYVIDSDYSSDADKKIAYVKLREALETIEEIKQEVCSSLDGWKQTVQTFTDMTMECCGSTDSMTAIDESRQQEADQIAQTVEATVVDTNERIKVLVLNKNQIGLNVVDEDKKPIQGATLTLTSVEQPSISSSGKTNENGAVAIDVSRFPLNDDGFVVVNAVLEADGKRTWRSDGRIVEGGKTLARDVVMKTDDGRPYIQGVSLRGTDILYNSDTLYITSYNNMEHSLVVHIDPKGQSGRISVIFSENNRSSSMAYNFDADTKFLTFKRKWCQSLTIGSSIQLQVSQNDWEYSVPLSVTVAKAVVPKPSEETLDVFGAESLFPGFVTTLQWHDKPWFNNLAFTLDIPFPHLKALARNITITPDGAYMFGINVALTHSFGDDIDDWKVKTNEIGSLMSKENCKMSNLVKTMQEAGVMKTRSDGKVGTMADATLDFGIEAVIHGFATEVKNSQGSLHFYNNATVAFMLKFFSTYTKYILAWAIPIHVGVDFGVNLTAGLQWKSSYYGDSIAEALNLKKFIQNGEWRGVVISLAPLLMAYAGVGIRGVLGVTLQGMFNFIFTFLLEQNGDAGYFKLPGDLSIMGTFFFASAIQSIITGNLVDKKLFDNRTAASETPEDTSSGSVAQDSDVVVTETITGTKSSLLNVSTTETAVSSDLTDVMDSAATTDGYIYLYNDQNKQLMIGWTGTDGKMSEDKTAILSQVMKDHYKGEYQFDPSVYYIYDTNFVVSGDKAFLCYLAGKYSENETKEIESDGKTITYVQNSKTYLGVALFQIVDGQLKCLDSDFVENGFGFYIAWGSYGGLDSLVLYANSEKGQYEIFTTCFEPERAEVLCTKWNYYDNNLDAGGMVNSDFLSLEHDTLKYGYYIDSIEQVSAANFYQGQSHAVGARPGVYCLFTDTGTVNQRRHIICIRAFESGERPSALIPNDSIEYMATVPRGNEYVSEDDVLFVTEKGGNNKYNLVAYRISYDTVNNEIFINREGGYSLEIPNPQIKMARTLGVDTLYWTETSGQYTEEDPTGAQYQVRCCFVKPDLLQTLITKPLTILTFDAKQYDPDKVSLSNLILINGPWGYGGTATKLSSGENGSENTAVAFRLTQVVEAQITGSMVNTPVISEGDPVTVLFKIENKGNVPLKAAKIKIQDVNNPNQYELVTVDFENPEKSNVEMHEGDTVINMNGTDAVSEYEGFASTDAGIVYVDSESNGEYMAEYNAMLPGDVRNYRVVFTIPSSWGHADERNLECTVTDYAVNAVPDSETNQYSAAAAFFVGAQIIDVNTGNATDYVTNDEVKEVWFSAETGEITQIVDVEQGQQAENNSVTPELAAAGTTDNVSASNSTGFDTFTVASSTNASSAVTMPSPILYLTASYSLQNGERVILMSIENTSSLGIKELVVRSYLDGSDEPTSAVSLTPDYSLKQTHTLSFAIPESSLTKGASTDVMQLVVSGVTADGEAIENDNICLVRLDEVLAITTQPQDFTVTALQTTATYQVEASGVGTLNYQWQGSRDGGNTWTELSGKTGSTLSFSVEKGQYGNDRDTKVRFRCVVTDTSGQTVTSDAAALYLEDIPQTGDTSDIALYAALAALSVFVLSVLVLRTGKRRQN